jgi:hypothetical protein
MILACGEERMSELHLTEEFYEWYCEPETDDYTLDRVHINTNTCDDSVTWITSEVHFQDGEIFARKLDKDTLSVNCEWYAYIPLINDYSCEDVDGVTLSAWVR